MPLIPIAVLFFFSGALGLVYEVLWMRQLTRLFGATSLAAAATFSAFFLGQALGSFALGARSRRWSRPLAAFGVLEITVGLSALAVPVILDFYRPLYPSLHGLVATVPMAAAFVKCLLAVAAIGVPTFFMGGTLPALGEAIAPPGRPLGVPVGGLYALNVLGATLGALAVPFVLLPALGLSGSYAAAVAGSLTVGVAALGVGARHGRRTPHADAPSLDSVPSAGGRRHVLWLAAWSGASTLGLEVLWARMFSMVHENSLYSFAVVVALFLLGLAGGAALARHRLGRGHAADGALAWTWSAAGLLVLLSPRLFYVLTHGFEYVPAGDGLASLGRLLTIAGLTVFPACLGLGAALPLLIEMGGSRDRPVGPLLGRILGVNTAAAIAGPLVVTFVVAPAFGLWGAIAILGALTFVLGQSRALSRGERLAAWITLAGVLLLATPTRLPPVRVRVDRGERLVSSREGSYGTAAVIEASGDRWITVNNSYVLGGTAATGEERWQAHLPLLLHPNPRRVAFIGLGTGITAGAARLHPVREVVALEIVPEVVEAARHDFARENLRLFDDPRLSVVVDDGRAYLASPPHPFDVIVGDLLVPWRPAESALYSREHFESVRRALAPQGLFCQWLPAYQLSREQLAILLRTFADVFPTATLWRGNFLRDDPVLALVGHGGGWDLAAIDRRAAALSTRVGEEEPFLKHPMGTWLFFVGSLRDGALAEKRRNRESQPWVELLSRRRGPALVGSHLLSFLEAVTAEPEHGLRLDEAHREWKDIGRRLALASVLPDPSAEGRVREILETLPPELREALGVDAPAPSLSLPDRLK